MPVEVKNATALLDPANQDVLLAPCFVIAPVGESAVKTQRTHWVMENYIEPACKIAGLKPEFVQQIRIEDLQSDRMVIAYMSKAPWTENVMIGVASRLTTGLPIVFLRETPELGEEKAFPVDLKDHPIILLPPEARDRPESSNDSRRERIEKIAEAIKKGSKEASSWLSAFAVASILMHIGDDIAPEKHVFLEASPEAMKLFEVAGKPVAGYPIMHFLRGLKTKMPAYQVDPFLEEQNRLISELVKPPINLGLYDTPVRRAKATVPMVFARHNDNEYHRRAFLPIILQHHTSGDGRFLRLKVLYLDVTASVRRADPPNLHFVCGLFTPTELLKIDLPDQGSDSSVEQFPVLCAYSDQDKNEVAQIISEIKEQGLDLQQVYPEVDLDGDLWEVDLRVALRSAKGVVVFFGGDEAGKWKEQELQKLTELCADWRIPFVVALLPSIKRISGPLRPALGEAAVTPIKFSNLKDEGAAVSLVQRLRQTSPR